MLLFFSQLLLCGLFDWKPRKARKEQGFKLCRSDTATNSGSALHKWSPCYVMVRVVSFGCSPLSASAPGKNKPVNYRLLGCYIQNITLPSIQKSRILKLQGRMYHRSLFLFDIIWSCAWADGWFSFRVNLTCIFWESSETQMWDLCQMPLSRLIDKIAS